MALAPFGAGLLDRNSEPVNPAFGATAERLGSSGSHRYTYWRVALQAFADDPAIGLGAGGFQTAWLERRDIDESVRDAHSLPLETAAELGLLGLLLLALSAGGVVAAIRRLGRSDPALAAGPTAALAVWAAHASIDWDWEMPAVTLVAAVLAGVLLARGYHRAPA
jgi:O-antigen ligase